jgi:hypothetical protein
MVTVAYNGDNYYFSNGSWYGLSRGNRRNCSGFYPGDNTKAPLCVFPDLRKVAIEQGVNPALLQRSVQSDLTEDDSTDEAPKSRKTRQSRAKKNSNSISIF